MASTEFQGRDVEDINSELEHILQRIYGGSPGFDLGSLCIVEGAQCWVIYVDVLVLERRHWRRLGFHAARAARATMDDEATLALRYDDDDFDVAVPAEDVRPVVPRAKKDHGWDDPAAIIADMNVGELKAALRAAGVYCGGRKQELADRLTSKVLTGAVDLESAIAAGNGAGADADAPMAEADKDGTDGIGDGGSGSSSSSSSSTSSSA